MIGERLRARLGRGRLKTKAREIPISASIGVATVSPREPIEEKNLIDAADKALYEVKR